MRRRVAVSFIVLLGVLGGCGGGDATSSPTASATSSPSSSVVPTPTANGSYQVEELPDSVLAKVPGIEYVSLPGVTAPQELTSKAEYWSGWLTRSYGPAGRTLGTVQVFRMREGAVPPAARAQILEGIFQDFGQTQAITPEQLAGQAVLTADKLRGTTWGAVAWTTGRDVVILSDIGGLAGARTVARAYIIEAPDSPA